MGPPVVAGGAALGVGKLSGGPSSVRSEQGPERPTGGGVGGAVAGSTRVKVTTSRTVWPSTTAIASTWLAPGRNGTAGKTNTRSPVWLPTGSPLTLRLTLLALE